MSNEPANTSEIETVLARLLVTGEIQRMPKHPRHQQILLALLALNFHRRYPYTEIELNATLKEAIALCHGLFDHVTCRRYMVDLGFLKRDRAGERYFLNFLKLKESLAESVDIDAREQLIQDARAKARTHKKRPPETAEGNLSQRAK